MTEPRMFNGATGAPYAESVGPDLHESAPAPEPTGLDLLDQLREAVQAREEEPVPETVAVAVPKLGLRLLCNPDFSYAKYRDWQKAGLPDKQRQGKKAPNPMDADQALTALLMLSETCEGVEFQRKDGSWELITDAGGNPVTVKDRAFLDRFSMIDPKSLLRKLFAVPGRSADAELIKASQIVIDASGYGNEVEAEADPTV